MSYCEGEKRIPVRILGSLTMDVPSIHLLDLKRKPEKISAARSFGAPKNLFLKITKLVFLVAFVATLAALPATNSFFTDSSETSENYFSSGYWIPELMMSVEAPDEDGWYETPPCVTLSANINGETDGITIYYEFSDDDDPIDGGTVYPGECVDVPEGNPTHFQAQAYNNKNHDWLSNIVSEDFKVGEHAHPGDVVINEVMWMGSEDDEKDQWIELKNVSDNDIHIKDWYLTYKDDDGNEQKLFEIKDERVIKDGKYYLASHYKKSDSAINVNPDDSGIDNFDYEKFQIKLYTDGDVLIDMAGNGTQDPSEGEDREQKRSMERNDEPKDGSDYDNWHTCLDDQCNDKTYWDNEGNNYGTPGADNLSGDDSESHKSKAKNEENNNSAGKNIETLFIEEAPLTDVPADEGIIIEEEDATGTEGTLEDAVVDGTVADVPAVDELPVDQPVEEIKEPEPIAEPSDVPVEVAPPEDGIS